jgi:hypothetical protein
MNQFDRPSSEPALYYSEDFDRRSRPVLPEIGDEAVDALVQDIKKTGFAVIPNYIESVDIEHLRSFVESKVAANGDEYLGLMGKAAFEATMLDAIAESPKFLNLIHRLYEKGYGRPPPPQTLYQVLRCLKGQSGLKHSYFFHYDSYVVTALLPIVIPETGSAGHLVMLPNSRNIRSSYGRNLFDKVMVDNKVTQKILRYFARSRQFGFLQIPIVPGNLYLFWGYRSIHANEV